MAFSLQGKSIVFTGTMSGMTRKEIETEAVRRGAVVHSTVTSKTDLLVCGDKPGSKQADAIAKGVPIMEEKLFLSVFGIAVDPKLDPATRKEASAKIEEIKKKIDGLWEEARSVADSAGVSFYYTGPDDHGGGKYYPARPASWVVIDENEYTGVDPNQGHPEHEDYHPWNGDENYGADEWNEGHWVSSSSRC